MSPGPKDVVIDAGGALFATLGRVEVEFAAAIIVRWHQANDFAEWQPFTRQQLADFMTSDPVIAKWAENPFWRPRPILLVTGDFVSGWDKTDVNIAGIVTEKFVKALRRRWS